MKYISSHLLFRHGVPLSFSYTIISNGTYFGFTQACVFSAIVLCTLNIFYSLFSKMNYQSLLSCQSPNIISHPSISSFFYYETCNSNTRSESGI